MSNVFQNTKKILLDVLDEFAGEGEFNFLKNEAEEDRHIYRVSKEGRRPLSLIFINSARELTQAPTLAISDEISEDEVEEHLFQEQELVDAFDGIAQRLDAQFDITNGRFFDTFNVAVDEERRAQVRRTLAANAMNNVRTLG